MILARPHCCPLSSARAPYRSCPHLVVSRWSGWNHGSFALDVGLNRTALPKRIAQRVPKGTPPKSALMSFRNSLKPMLVPLKTTMVLNAAPISKGSSLRMCRYNVNFCDYHGVFNWRELEFSCDQCPGGEPVEGAMQASGAYSTRADLATDFYELEIETGWRKTRPDYWECVTHFTSPHSFAEILRQSQAIARRCPNAGCQDGATG